MGPRFDTSCPDSEVALREYAPLGKRAYAHQSHKYRIVRDIFANPQYASQMTAAFTEQNAIHQAIEEKRRMVDAEHLANIEKAKNHVIIYAWPMVHLIFITNSQC